MEEINPKKDPENKYNKEISKLELATLVPAAFKYTGVVIGVSSAVYTADAIREHISEGIMGVVLGLTGVVLGFTSYLLGKYIEVLNQTEINTKIVEKELRKHLSGKTIEDKLDNL